MSASTSTPSNESARRGGGWRRELLQTLAVLVLLGVFRASFANHYVVPSGSMEPTLQIGDRVAVDMVGYGLRVPMTLTRIVPGRAPQRGEVVVFDSPQDGTRLIKRVVAVGGDTVALRDGRLWINGTPQANGAGERLGTRAFALDLRDGGGPDIASSRIPAGMLLMVGDHRGNSFDGRFFGLVPERAVYGRALAVYYRRGKGLGWMRL